MNKRKIIGAVLLGSMTLLAVTTTPQKAVYAQEQDTRQVSESTLADITLPESAFLVPLKIVPSQVSDALDMLIKAGGPGVRRGKTEVLAWMGPGYKMSRVPQMKSQMGAKLKAAGWDYKEGEPLPGAETLTMVSIMRTTPQKQGVLGFWVPTKDALLLAWTEMVASKSGTAPADGGEQLETEVPDAATGEESAPEEPATGGFETPAPGAKSGTPPQEFQVPTTRAVINVMKGVAPPRVTFAAMQSKPGTVRGYVKDSKGRPLQGAVIGVRSSATGGFYSGAQGKTDAKGYYEIAVPWGAAEFYCAGYTTDYFGERAAMGLFPADGEASQFASANGIVENWVLLPYGVADRDRASEQPHYLNNYYGGGLSIGYFVSDPRFGEDGGLPEGAEIDLSLIPAGPLLDGSKGRTFVFHQKVVDGVAQGFKIVNVPVGQYRMVAWLIHNGKPSVLKMKETGPKSSQPFGMEPKQTDRQNESGVITFRPNGATASNVAAGYGNWDTLDITLSR